MAKFPDLTPTIPAFTKLQSIQSNLAEAARSIYDGWHQDTDGFDDEYGAGGICHDIASAMVGCLNDHEIEHAVSVHSTIGENHVHVVALLSDGIYSIDIPPSVYETGGGYVWKKRQNAIFNADSVQTMRISDPLEPEEFYRSFED